MQHMNAAVITLPHRPAGNFEGSTILAIHTKAQGLDAAQQQPGCVWINGAAQHIVQGAHCGHQVCIARNGTCRQTRVHVIPQGSSLRQLLKQDVLLAGKQQLAKLSIFAV